MNRPTCATCPYFDEAGVQCRRHAPSPKWMEDVKLESHKWEACWPEINGAEDEWCGDHPDFPAYLAERKGATVHYVFDEKVVVRHREPEIG